jgi:hypothetical protein
VRLARELAERLSTHLEAGGELEASLCLNGETVAIPAAAARLLAVALSRLGEGKGATFVPADMALSVAQAAALLNTSEDYVLRKGSEGALPVKGNTVPLWAVLEHKRKSDEEQRAAMDELAALDQEWGLGYGP